MGRSVTPSLSSVMPLCPKMYALALHQVGSPSLPSLHLVRNQWTAPNTTSKILQRLTFDMVLVNQLLGLATLDVIEFLGFVIKNLAWVLFLWILVMTTAVRLIVRQNSTNRGNKKCPVIVVILLLLWLLGFFKFFVPLQVGVSLGLMSLYCW